MGHVVDAIRRLIADHGPMSPGQLAHELGLPTGRVSEILRRWAKATPRRAYIARWDVLPDSQHLHPVPLYALGDKPDAKKPAPLSRKVTNRRHWKLRTDRLERFAPGADLQRIWS